LLGKNNPINFFDKDGRKSIPSDKNSIQPTIPSDQGSMPKSKQLSEDLTQSSGLPINYDYIPEEMRDRFHNVKWDGYKMGIAINVSGVDKYESVNPSDNPGHSFVYLKSPEGTIVDVLSYGPAPGRRPEFELYEFRNDLLPATNMHPLIPSDEYRVYEFDLTYGQTNDLKMIIDRYKYLENKKQVSYSPEKQCTTVIVDIAELIDLEIPKGVGKINPPIIESWEASTPYHLDKELNEIYGGPSKESTGADFKKVLPMK